MIHMLDTSYKAICGDQGIFTGSMRRKDVICPRCREKLGLDKPVSKLYIKSGSFSPRDPVARGANA